MKKEKNKEWIQKKGRGGEREGKRMNKKNRQRWGKGRKKNEYKKIDGGGVREEKKRKQNKGEEREGKWINVKK